MGFDIEDFIYSEDVDFLDFGSSWGGSLKFGVEVLGGKKGLGIDVNQKRVDSANESGVLAINFDIHKIPDVKLVNFVILSHFLEHIPDYNEAIEFLVKAARVSRDFVFIKQPNFDSDGYLMEKGFKTFYSDWDNHPNHMTSIQLYSAINDLKDLGLCKSFKIGKRERIKDSDDPRVLPLMEKKNSHHYNTAKHGRKKFQEFENVFFENVAVIYISKCSAKIPRERELFRHLITSVS